MGQITAAILDCPSDPTSIKLLMERQSAHEKWDSGKAWLPVRVQIKTFVTDSLGSYNHSKWIHSTKTPPSRFPALSVKRAFWVFLVTAVGKEAIPDALAGKDVVARLPTNSGKSLCFQWPYLTRTELPEGLHHSLTSWKIKWVLFSPINLPIQENFWCYSLK